MTQADLGTLVASETSGGELAVLLRAWRSALHSMHAGPARPAYAVPGTMWLDTSVTPNVIRLFDGATDTELMADKLDKAGDTMTGNLTIEASAPSVRLTNTTDAGGTVTRQVHHNVGLIGFLGSDGNWIMRVDDNGAVWTRQLGDVKSYADSSIANSANLKSTIVALANSVFMNSIYAGSELRDAYTGDYLGFGGSWRCAGRFSIANAPAGSGLIAGLFYRYA